MALGQPPAPEPKRSQFSLFNKSSGNNDLHFHMYQTLQTPVVCAHSDPPGGSQRVSCYCPLLYTGSGSGHGIMHVPAPPLLGDGWVSPYCPLWACRHENCCPVMGTPILPLLEDNRWSALSSPLQGVQESSGHFMGLACSLW